MAVGGSDWADAGAWVQSARSPAAARPGRDAGASERTDTRSRARFGEALDATRSRDETVSRAPAAREASRDARTEIAKRETGAAERTAGDWPQASRRADDAPVGGRGKAGRPEQDAVRRERADDTATASQDPTEAGDAGKAGDTGRAGDTAKADGTGKDDAAKVAEAATDPDVAAATGRAAGIATPQPNLAALFAALTGGGAVAAGAEGAATGAAGGEPIQGATGPGATGPGATSPFGGSTTAATGSATQATVGAAGAPQAGAGPASPTDGPAIAEAVHAKPRGDASEGASQPDFLTALSDASRDAAQGAAGPSPVAAIPASAAPSATHAASSAAPAAQAAAASQAAPAVQIGQVPMTIGLRSLQGSSEFQIRLDPAELGRIEVKLEIDKARGTVMTHLVVDRPETLQMLQRDVGQLQQALSQAGLDASGGVGVSLRGDGGAQNGSPSEGENRSRGGGAWSAEGAEPVQEAAPMRVLRGYGGLDIRI